MSTLENARHVFDFETGRTRLPNGKVFLPSDSVGRWVVHNEHAYRMLGVTHHILYMTEGGQFVFVTYEYCRVIGTSVVEGAPTVLWGSRDTRPNAVLWGRQQAYKWLIENNFDVPSQLDDLLAADTLEPVTHREQAPTVTADALTAARDAAIECMKAVDSAKFSICADWRDYLRDAEGDSEAIHRLDEQAKATVAGLCQLRRQLRAALTAETLTLLETAMARAGRPLHVNHSGRDATTHHEAALHVVVSFCEELLLSESVWLPRWVNTEVLGREAAHWLADEHLPAYYESLVEHIGRHDLPDSSAFISSIRAECAMAIAELPRAASPSGDVGNVPAAPPQVHIHVSTAPTHGPEPSDGCAADSSSAPAAPAKGKPAKQWNEEDKRQVLCWISDFYRQCDEQNEARKRSGRKPRHVGLKPLTEFLAMKGYGISHVGVRPYVQQAREQGFIGNHWDVTDGNTDHGIDPDEATSDGDFIRDHHGPGQRAKRRPDKDRDDWGD